MTTNKKIVASGPNASFSSKFSKSIEFFYIWPSFLGFKSRNIYQKAIGTTWIVDRTQIFHHLDMRRLHESKRHGDDRNCMDAHKADLNIVIEIDITTGFRKMLYDMACSYKWSPVGLTNRNIICNAYHLV